MKKRNGTLLLAALLLVTALSPRVFAAAGDYIAANHTRSNGSPYYIMVNRAQNTVTVYTLDGRGYYTVPYKAMICSTGKEGSKTPLGTFRITGNKWTWLRMLDNTYAQYVTQFKGNYLFHSVCYEKPDPSTVLEEEYNILGEPASLGCIRLEAVDAKWISDNCGTGTMVTVYDGVDPGPLGKPERTLDRIPADLENGWEPTDPRPENPWHTMLARGISLEEAVTVGLGESYPLSWSLIPAAAKLPEVKWSSSDPDVVTVDAQGILTGVGVGTAVVTASCGKLSQSCTVTVRGEYLLGFVDVPLSAWYCESVRFVYETGILKGTGPKSFSPDAPMSYAMALTVLYRLAGEPALKTEPEGQKWYSAALCWAREWNRQEDEPLPGTQLTNQWLAQLLYRYEMFYCGRDVGDFIDYYDRLRGENKEELALKDAATRAGAAEMLKNLLNMEE